MRDWDSLGSWIAQMCKDTPYSDYAKLIVVSGTPMTKLAFFFSVLIAVCAATARADDRLRFVTLEFAPFIYGENQQVAGPGRDVIAEACLRAGIACSFDIYPWRRAQELMKAGDADGMMVIGRNPAREEWLDFSPPLFRTEYGFFVAANNPLIYDEQSQVAGYRVGVFAPSNTETQLKGLREEQIAQQVEPIEIDGHPDDAAGMRKLAANRLDAVYSNRDRGWGIISDEELGGKVRYAGGDKAILYYAGIRKDFPDPDVVKRFFDSWPALYSDGTAQRIIEGYGLEPAPQE
ncbi:substrate-binding periplasmic protein [Ruegeria meonggei]|uniref:substrate-binding periplasmic protein n=1 Tax=Ruegeria meonggei TaxID=1446476 RepID=UPI00366D9528